MSDSIGKLETRPLTPDLWADLEVLFGERGACGGCWCMWWKLSRSEFERSKGAKNKRAMRKIVADGPPPGILAYVNGQPAGWCALAPRDSYPSLERSRVLKPVDDKQVWSVTCFFIARPFRNRGLSSKLLKAAVAFARDHGARIIEGYPVEPRKGRMPDAFAWTGLPASFTRAGFKEVLRRSPTRPIMRRAVRPERSAGR